MSCNRQTPQTGVLKFGWWSLCKMSPSDSRKLATVVSTLKKEKKFKITVQCAGKNNPYPSAVFYSVFL